MNSPILTQIFVAISTQLAAISMGGSMGMACVLLQQFKAYDSTIHPDLDTSTWIISTFGLAGIPSIIMPTVMQLKGRRISFTICCICITSGWLLMYFANSTATLITAQIFSGLGSYSVVVVNLMTVSEMIGPKYRAVIMMMLGLNQSIGMTVVTTIGNYVHWKTICLIMTFPVACALLMVLLWPESPSWLAYTGNFEACERAFKRLRGAKDEDLRELELMIVAQRQNRKICMKDTKTCDVFLKNIMTKDFYLPIFYSLLVLSYFYLSGASCMYIYYQQILEDGTRNPTASLYGYMYRDASLVIGSIMAIIFVKSFKSKPVLLVTSFGSIFSLVCCFLIGFSQFTGILSKDSLLLIYAFSVYMTFCNSGFNYITFTLSSELIPVKHRGLGGALFIVYTCSLHALGGKIYPYLVLYFYNWGAFLIFAVFGSVIGITIWKVVPETTNRTLQEIEDYYNHGDFVPKKKIDKSLTVPIVEGESIFEIKTLINS